jgi:hypothetical protein
MKFKKKINENQLKQLPLSFLEWEYEDTSNLKIEDKWHGNKFYNTGKIRSGPFYKSISKIFELK